MPGKKQPQEIKEQMQKPRQLTKEEIEKNCVFCKIAKGEIPCTKIYEDNEVLVFLDINPVNPGHALVVPKKHFATILDLPSSLAILMISAAKKVAVSQVKALKSGGFNIEINNFPASGQLVPHVHFHVVPRFPKDGLKHWPGRKYREGNAEKIAQKLRETM